MFGATTTLDKKNQNDNTTRDLQDQCTMESTTISCTFQHIH